MNAHTPNIPMSVHAKYHHVNISLAHPGRTRNTVHYLTVMGKYHLRHYALTY